MPLTLPKPSPAAVSWTAESAIARSESPFSFRAQTYDHGGQRNRVTIELPTMSAAEGRDWLAFFRAINGMAGEFYIYPLTLADPQRGSLRGAPAVSGAGQTGDTLTIDGLPPNTSGILRAGDWVSIGDRLHTLTADITTDATGSASLTLWPRIATAPADGDPVEVRNPRGVFKLANPAPTLTLNNQRLYTGVSFEAVESL